MANSEKDFSRMVDRYLPGSDDAEVKEVQEEVVRISRDLPIQATLDLHGETLEQARKLLDRFLKDSASRGLRKILVVHGKGSGVLKEGLARYLEGHPLAGKREHPKREDGGSGALTVLIKNTK